VTNQAACRHSGVHAGRQGMKTGDWTANVTNWRDTAPHGGAEDVACCISARKFTGIHLDSSRLPAIEPYLRESAWSWLSCMSFLEMDPRGGCKQSTAAPGLLSGLKLDQWTMIRFTCNECKRQQVVVLWPGWSAYLNSQGVQSCFPIYPNIPKATIDSKPLNTK
jgi:hypothetical protein